MAGEHIGWDPLRIEVLWGLKEAPRRGPKPALTVDQIARAAIRIADDEGLDALSMQRLAGDLGVGTMTLYTYVPDKATLLEVMFDRAFDEVTPASNSGDWRSHLEQMAQGVMSAYQRHPWALQIFVGGPPLGPNQIRGMEGALRAFEGVDLDDAGKLDAIMAVTSFVRGAAHLSVGLGQHLKSSGMTDEQLEAEYARAYATVLDPERFPATVAVLAGVFGSPTERDDDTGFRFGLSRLLDGIERHIDSGR
jgi:AcrR family transcriptional regulator